MMRHFPDSSNFLSSSLRISGGIVKTIFSFRLSGYFAIVFPEPKICIELIWSKKLGFSELSIIGSMIGSMIGSDCSCTDSILTVSDGWSSTFCLPLTSHASSIVL